MKADDIINHLNLEKHPEGGWFKETYRSDTFIGEDTLPAGYKHGRNLKTVIYFLLKSGEKSASHRLRSDEFWYWHSESSLEVIIIHPDGNLQIELMGTDILNGQSPQLLLPAGTWFAARCTKPQSFALISCSVTPGFDFSDFELAEREALTKQFPQHQKIINELTN